MYLNPFPPNANRVHIVKVVENEQAAFSVYKLKVQCDCQWEVLCQNENEATNWTRAHLARHGQPMPPAPPAVVTPVVAAPAPAKVETKEPSGK